MSVSGAGQLLHRAERLAEEGRRLLGIVGAPGSGKSTLAELVVSHLGGAALHVGMDGFHLAGSELARLGRAGRKGAPDTFDADGYVALLRRLRATPTADVYAPEFRREIEEPVAGAVLVSASTALVVTEGNYLLLDDPPWSPVRDLLDEVWFVDVDEERRVEQLIARHVRFGRTESQARAWALSTDQRNAELVASTRRRADVVVRLDGGSVRIVPGEDEESR